MRILYITNMYPGMTPTLPYAGIFVKEQIEAIEKNCPDCETRVFVINGVSSKLNYFKSLFDIRRTLKEYNPDIIHVHYGLSALFLLRYPEYGYKTIITLHGGDIMPQQKKWMQIFLTRRVIKKAAHVVVMNIQMENTVESIIPRYSTIKCGVDVDFFDCGNGIKKASDKKIIIFPADPRRTVKNYTLFRKTIDYVEKETHHDLDIITLTNMSRKDIKMALCNADCMLLTSVSEGSPQVIKEAMACNLPVVSVDVGDVRYVLKNVANSYISTKGTAEELGDHVIDVISNGQRSDGVMHLKSLKLDNHSISKTLLELYHNTMPV